MTLYMDDFLFQVSQKIYDIVYEKIKNKIFKLIFYPMHLKKTYVVNSYLNNKIFKLQ